MGNMVRIVRMEFGKVVIIICGDFYNRCIVKWVRRKRLDFFFVFMEYLFEYGELNEEDIVVMLECVGFLGVKIFIVNSFLFGGVWVFDGDGMLIGESRGEGFFFWEG